MIGRIKAENRKMNPVQKSHLSFQDKPYQYISSKDVSFACLEMDFEMMLLST